MRRIFVFNLFLVLLCGTFEPVQAQTKLSLKRKVSSDSTAHRFQPKAEVVIDFPNLNKISFFENRRELRTINRLEKRKEYAKALPLLRNYVNNFGIENFYRNTSLLWRLAQLYERANDLDHAKAFYRLALKHTRSDITKIQLYYDSLEAKSKSLYLPLNFYYELVEYRKAVNTFQPPKGVYTNMGPDVNSKYEDYGPTMNANTNNLIFTSRRNRGPSINSGYNEDLFYTENINGNWEKAKSFGKPINSTYNEGSACLSKDGQTLYFARCDCRDCHGNCDLYVAKKMKDGTWGNIKNLGMQVNSPSWDSQPTLSRSEDTLYFASDRLGGFGTSDIYFTAKQKNSRWGPAKNMGPVINTRESEVSPFFHPKYQVLYFSSRGQLLNNGDFDIYKTYRVNGRWQEPRNIGPLVNGKGSEYYFTIDGKSENLYYARSEANDLKNLDLYSFPLPMEAQPLAVTRLEGTLVDSVTNSPLAGIVSVIDLTNGIEVASKYIRNDGSFDFDLIDQNRYMLLIQSPDFFSVEKEIDLKQDTVLKIMTSAINYKIPLIFKNIEFDEGKSDIKPIMEPILDRIVLFLADHPTFTLKIGGHTDASGDPEFNTELSQKRADSIKKYIEQKGKIPDDRVQAWGYGSSEPLREEQTEEDRQINRRVEFKLVKPEPANLKE
ncbi:OmpA family protein [Adhaeribacter pallidiroseus]|uniref:Peptidoglycan-associated lipoprotein n=1 Tax=Adhaeribacter pallidiroseus TaxID=2072847 RepID=A0A369QCZ2_9BACT|nr:OmpA family protein [Adhaeribacter pallidiroseus]RDC61435.1 Peptidoglycan-associated lipoprotein [Adhaeribacter pallidiroseus]